MVLKVGIIGGGVSGFCCGVRILENLKSKVSVTIISEDFTPDTTGDVSAGLWGPFLCGKTSPAKLYKWAKETHDFFLDLWRTENPGETGICLQAVTRVATQAEGLPTFWKNIVYGFRDLKPSELKVMGDQHGRKYTAAASFCTYTCEPIKFLPYLMKRFDAAGGLTKRGKIENLNEFVANSEYDVVINCSGLGSKYIIPDPEMYSVRGQVIRVEAPWMFYTIIDESDDGRYIIPNIDTVILGGTHQINDYNTNVSKTDRDFIKEGVADFLPGIAQAKTLGDGVGLRPGRDSIRVEKEMFDNGVTVIHNYGHGGCGVTLGWGCASEVLQLLQETFYKSKL